MRQRTFYYSWCGKTETDYICSHCETIVADVAAGCQHCSQSAEKSAIRIAKLKGTQQRMELSEPTELKLF